MKEYRGKASAELPDVVREALDALRPVPDINQDAWEAGRERFLLEARQLAASSNEHRVPSWLAPVLSFLRLDANQVRPMAVVWRAALIIALVLGGSFGTVSAARASLPGSPFYPLKMQLETWEMDRLREPEEVTERALTQAQQRVEEASRLTDRGREVPEEVAELYQERLETALQASSALSEPQRLQAQSEISQTIDQQLEVMASVAARVRGDDDAEVEDGARAGEGIRALIRVMEQTQARLGERERESADDHEDDGRHGVGAGGGPQGPPEESDADDCDDGVCGEAPAGDGVDEEPDDADEPPRPNRDDNAQEPGQDDVDGDDDDRPGKGPNTTDSDDDDESGAGSGSIGSGGGNDDLQNGDDNHGGYRNSQDDDSGGDSNSGGDGEPGHHNGRDD